MPALPSGEMASSGRKEPEMPTLCGPGAQQCCAPTRARKADELCGCGLHFEGTELGLGLQLGIAVEAIGEPCYDGDHAEPTELTGEVADFLVVEKNSPLFKKNGPITFVGIDDWEDKGAGVSHVRANVKKVFEEPEEREGEAVGLAMEEEECSAEQRDQELTKGATQDHDGVAKPAEEEMSGFVDGEIGVIEEEEAGVVAVGIKEEEEIEGEAETAAEAGNACPVVGSVEREFHEKSVTARGLGGRGIEGGVALEERRERRKGREA